MISEILDGDFPTMTKGPGQVVGAFVVGLISGTGP